MLVVMFACVAPNLYEAASPLLNPGESEPALYFEGPGVLVEGRCDGPGLALEVEPGGVWPYLLGERELAEVWVVAGGGAQEGEYACSVGAGMLDHGFVVEVVEL